MRQAAMTLAACSDKQIGTHTTGAAMSSFNVREEITNRIVSLLEKGVLPWRQGWSGGEPHSNASTGLPYKGINAILLGISGFSDPRWLTMKQANAMKDAEHPNGLHVRKGEKATMIVRMVDVPQSVADDKVDGDIIAEDSKSRLVMKSYYVFNAQQIDGMPVRALPERSIESHAAVEHMLAGLKADGLVLLEGGQKAFYMPKADSITLPDRNRFDSGVERSSVLLHEMAHATGHSKRKDRFDLFGKLSTVEARAREELKAELASAMLGAELGLPLGDFHIENHAAYVGSWLEALKKDKTEIFKAAAGAQHICDWLNGHAVVPEQKVEAKAEAQTIAANDEVLPPADKPKRRAGMRM
jgi:antirestriction protein ArdC